MLGERRWAAPCEAAVVAAWGLGFPVTPASSAEGELVLSPAVPLASACAEALRAALWALTDGGRLAVFSTRLVNAACPVAAALRAGLRGAHRDRGTARGSHAAGSANGTARPPAVSRAASAGSAQGDVSRDGGTHQDERNDEEEPPRQDVAELLRQTLADLALLGDVVSLPGGYWLPAPGRVVPLAAGSAAEHAYVVLGGPPAQLLPEPLRQALVPGGLARVLRAGVASEALATSLAPYPVQPDAVWRRRPPELLATWARDALAGARLTTLDDASVAFEAYAPRVTAAARAGQRARPAGPGGAGVGRTTPPRWMPSQYFRWVPAAGVPDGRYVVRYETAIGRRTGVAEVVSGRVVAVGDADLGAGDVRRLLYGVDALEGLPTVARVREDVASHQHHITLSSVLPGPELRLCTAVSRLRLPAGDRYLPQTWEVPSAAAGDVLAALTADLGVVLHAEVAADD